MRTSAATDHGKFCRCTHTERSHGPEGCRVYRLTDVRGRMHHCRCPLTPEQVRRNEDHLAVVVAHIADRAQGRTAVG